MWAGFSTWRGDPIGFQVQRLNHSAITAISSSFFMEFSGNRMSSFWEQRTSLVALTKLMPHLAAISQLQKLKDTANAVSVEPAQGDPIGFLVQRLNHSAITAISSSFFMEFSGNRISHLWETRTTLVALNKLMPHLANAVSRIWTCAGRPHWISSPTP